jgi:hypothetical protein
MRRSCIKGPDSKKTQRTFYRVEIAFQQKKPTAFCSAVSIHHTMSGHPSGEGTVWDVLASIPGEMRELPDAFVLISMQLIAHVPPSTNTYSASNYVYSI